MSKRYAITARFNQALIKHMTQSVSVEAGSIPSALARGLRDIMRRPGIKGKRHRTVQISIVLSHMSADTEESAADA